MSRTIIYAHVNIILEFPITFRNTSVLCQSECACLHKTLNMVVFCVKSNENIYPKGILFCSVLFECWNNSNSVHCIVNHFWLWLFTLLHTSNMSVCCHNWREDANNTNFYTTLLAFHSLTYSLFTYTVLESLSHSYIHSSKISPRFIHTQF